jgi:hypothetical protein
MFSQNFLMLFCLSFRSQTVTLCGKFAILVRCSHLKACLGHLFSRPRLFVALRQSYHKHHNGIGRFRYILSLRSPISRKAAAIMASLGA